MMVRALIPQARKWKILRRPPESILPSTPRPARRDCHGRLINALLDFAGSDAQVTDCTLSPWCSATFVGARHCLSLWISGPMADSRSLELARLLPDAEFDIAGHIVADLAIDDRTVPADDRACLRLSVLTIEAW